MNSPPSVDGDRSPPEPAAILVIGDVMLDIVAAPRSSLEIGTDTPAAIMLAPGGSGANTAAWIGSFGGNTAFVGRAGVADAAWHDAALHEHGVRTFVIADQTRRTGVLISLVSPDGERSFLTDRGANDGLSPGDFPETLLDGVGLVHVSAYSLSRPEPRAAVLAFLAAARARAIPITVDPASVALLRQLDPRHFIEWTRMASICFPNEAEALFLSGTGDVGEALHTLTRSYELVVVKRGAAGASAASRAGKTWAQTAPQVDVLDSTGAGDAFVAGFLTAYVRGQAVGTCLREGVSAGSAATTWYGGRPMTPDAIPAPWAADPIIVAMGRTPEAPQS